MSSLKSSLSIGFRPFFLLACFMAVINPTLWVSVFSGHSEFSPYGGPAFWHGHEMIFGFTSALIAGFLLTASSNWTGTKPYSGLTLAFLILTWLLERLSFFISSSDSQFLTLSNSFYPILIILLAIRLKTHKKQLFVFIPILLALACTKALHSFGSIMGDDFYQSIGLDSGVALLRLLVFLIAGRVLPFFTRKRLGLESLEVPPLIHISALAPLFLLAIPNINFFKELFAVLLIIAAMTNLNRLRLLFRTACLRVPMLLVLHIGLLFMILALILEAFSIYYPSLNENREVLHATMAGGMGVIAIGIMTRVSLGHTGRAIKAGITIQMAYLCIFLGAIFRVLIPILFPSYYESSLHYASGFWTLGFLIFIIIFLKPLTTPRPDGKAY